MLEALWTNFNQVADGFGLNLAVFQTICSGVDGLRVTAEQCQKLFAAFDSDQVRQWCQAGLTMQRGLLGVTVRGLPGLVAPGLAAVPLPRPCVTSRFDVGAWGPLHALPAAPPPHPIPTPAPLPL